MSKLKLGALCLCRKSHLEFKKGKTYRVCDYENDMIWFSPDENPIFYNGKPLPRFGFLLPNKQVNFSHVSFQDYFFTPQEERKMKLEILTKFPKQM